MAGTLLRDDWQKAVEDQLRGAADAAQAALRAAAPQPQPLQVIADQPAAPDPNAVMQSLQQHAQQAFGGLQVIGGGVQQSAQDVQSQLQQTADQAFGGLIPLQRPTPPQSTAPMSSDALTNPPLEQPAALRPSLGASGRIPAEINVPVDQGPSITRAQTNAALRGTALDGYGDAIYDLGVKYNVDPAFALSVARNESNYGSSPAQARNNNIFSISNALYGGSPVAGSRWGQYPTKEAGIEAFFKLLTTEYYPKGQTTIGSVMWGPQGSQQHAYAPTSENSPDYPNRLIRTMREYGSSAESGPLERVAGAVQNAVHPPLTPRQTPGTQIANTPNADGQIFPLAGPPTNKPNQTYHSQGGSDLMAPRGTPVLNMRSGTVSSVYTDNGSHQAGGNAVMIRGDDGLDYYYAHFDQPPGLKEGQRVETGAQIGAVGNSGNAFKGGQGETHLHIGIGKGISNGVGSEGGLGRDYNAQRVLADLLSGVGQATTTARTAAQVAAGVPRDDQPPGDQGLTMTVAQAGKPAPIVNVQPERNPLQVLGDLAGPAAQRVGATFEDVGRGAQSVANDLGGPGYASLQAEADRLRQQAETDRLGRQAEGKPYDPLEALGQGVLQQSAQGREAPGQIYGADQAAGQALAGLVVDQAKAAGWQPTPQEERFARTTIGTVTPANVLLTVLTTGQATTARILAEGAMTLAGGGLGQATGQALVADTDLPEWAKVGAEVVGGLAGGVGGIAAARAGRSPGARAAAGRFIADESGELRLGRDVPEGVPQATTSERPGATARVPEPPESPAVPARRMYHGTANEFERPTADHFDPNGLFGPGYYLTSDPRVAGGRVGEGVERGKVITEGYSQASATPRNESLLSNANQSNHFLAALADEVEQMSIPGARKLGEWIREDVSEGVSWTEGIRNIINYDSHPEFKQLVRDWDQGLRRQGAQMRAVDVPEGLNLLDVEVPLAPETKSAISKALRSSSDPRDVPVADQFDEWTTDPSATGKTAYDALANVNPTFAQQTLSRAGFDGISYSGGQRMSMTDESGSNIGHDVAVVFPDSLEKIRNAISGRQGGQADPAFATQLGGAALGGAAGGTVTPEDAPPEEKLRNIGIGALAGLAGGRAIGGRMGPPLEPAFARAAVGEAPTGFRAPGGLGDDLLQARAAEPQPGAQPRRLSEVRSNRYLLNEAEPGATPLTDDEILEHYDTLEQRLDEVKSRADAIDESLRNRAEKPIRPEWGAGYSNEALIEIARRHNVSPYAEKWWDTAGLSSGSGEVRMDVGQSGLRGTGAVEKTPTELRQELRALRQEEADIMAAADQLGSASPGAAFTRRPDAAAPARGDLPFDQPVGREPDVPEPVPVGEAQGGRDEGARMAQDVVLSKGRGRLRSNLNEVRGDAGGVTGRAILTPEGVAQVNAKPPTTRTAANMPNLDSMLEGDMPEIAAQIRKSAEDNPELFELYRQGTVSFDSLRNDLAGRVGMTRDDWLKTPVGKGFSTEELVALQAAAVEAEGRLQDMGSTILARGGVDTLSPEELAYSLSELVDTQRLLAVARGGRSTQGRSLNALKIKFDRTLASSITAGNEATAAKRTAAEARKAAVKATRLLTKGRELEQESQTAVAAASRNGAPKNILNEIADAYAQLDRYQAMTLHEKADDFAKLAAERAARAAARKGAVRGAPEELLSALRAELKAEQNIFAKRKDTWETQAFWDTKANEAAAEKRNAFRGQLYLEQQRKVAQIAAKEADQESKRAFDAELRRRTNQTQKAEALLKAIGGVDVGKDTLRQFLAAMDDPSPYAAAKYLKGISSPSGFARANIIRVAGLLSAPITHMINVGGNAGNAMLDAGTRGLVVPIDAIRAAITGGERQAYRAELLPMLQAYGPGFLGAWGNARKALATGVTPAEMADLSKVRPGFGSGSEAVDTAVEIPLRLLTAEDILFRSGAVSAHGMRVGMRQAIREGFKGESAKGRAATILKNLEEYPDLAQEVNDAAARQVFQEKRTLPLISGHETPGVALARSQVLPFVRTPANITAQGAALSPLGLVGTVREARKAATLPRATAAQRVTQGGATLQAEERLARTMIGSAILGGGLALGAAGMLTADFPEDDQARSALPQGWRPWSVRLEDPVTNNTYYIPMQNVAAVGFPLALAAIITDPTHKKDPVTGQAKTILSPDEQLNAATAIGRYVIDNTFLQGVSDFVDLLHDPRTGAAKFAEPWVASFGPYSSLNRELLRTFGVAQRNPREGFIGLVDALEANYPGLSGNVPEALTPLGEPRSQGATGLGRLAPARYDIERDEPTLKILREAGVGIPRAPKDVSVGRGQAIELSEAERDQVQRARGDAIRQAVEEVQTTRAWQTSSAADRTALLKQAVNYGTRTAIIDFYQSLPRAEQDARSKARDVPESYYIGGAP